eukprot:7200226-Prymnesium_polylepis.1
MPVTGSHVLSHGAPLLFPFGRSREALLTPSQKKTWKRGPHRATTTTQNGRTKAKSDHRSMHNANGINGRLNFHT